MPLDSDMKKQEHLWQNQSPNFLAEKAFNAAVAALQPHCAICSLFCPYTKVQQPSATEAHTVCVSEVLMGSDRGSSSKIGQIQMFLVLLTVRAILTNDGHRYNPLTVVSFFLWPLQPHKGIFISNDPHSGSVPRHGSLTRPLVPEMCFSVGACNTEPPPTNYHIGEDGTSVLLRCSSCHMQVHASKYNTAGKKAGCVWVTLRANMCGVVTRWKSWAFPCMSQFFKMTSSKNKSERNTV